MSDLPGDFDQILTLITPTVIVALIGITISLITFFYRRKQLQLNGLIEIIRDLHLPAHKEARNITYHGESAISEETFGILGLES